MYILFNYMHQNNVVKLFVDLGYFSSIELFMHACILNTKYAGVKI